MQHFLTEATEQLAGFSMSLKQFCQSIAPQLSYHYPAVRYALLTVAARTQAATFRWDKQTQRNDALAWKSSALLYYNRSIHSLTASNSPTTPASVFLVCGLLFAGNELWPHLDMNFAVHVITAFKLVLESVSTLPADVQKGMYPYLIHMARKTLAQADDIDPKLESALRRFAWLEQRPSPVPEIFDSMNQAWAVVDDLQNCISALSSDDPEFVIEARPQAIHYAAKISNALLRSRREADDPALHAQYRALMMHHRVLQVMLDTKIGTDEGIYDLFTADFEHILYECEFLVREQQHSETASGGGPWHPSLGLLAPLFFVATRCRIASLRHRAIKALRSSPRREREWNSCIASILARHVVRTEEAQRQPEEHDGSIHVKHRIRLDSVKLRRQDEEMDISYVNPWTNEYGIKTLSWKAKDAIDDEFECVTLSRKRLEMSGYSGIVLVTPTITCQCGDSDGARRLSA